MNRCETNMKKASGVERAAGVVRTAGVVKGSRRSIKRKVSESEWKQF